MTSDDHMLLYTVETGPCFEIRKSNTQNGTQNWTTKMDSIETKV